MTNPNDGSKPFDVFIYATPHSLQRYPTAGDWHYGPQGEALFITVSRLEDRREIWLVAIHELIEAALCEVAGITQERVDAFDTSQEHYFEGEPGDQSSAPYYRQHQFATGIERLLAAEMGVDWLTYERHIQELDAPPSGVANAQPLVDMDDIPF